MKISIPTNDRKTVEKRTGRCEEFAVYEISDKKIINTEYRKNNHNHNHDEGEEHEHSHDDIMQLLSDVDLMVVNLIGKHMKNDLKKHKMEFRKTKENDIEIILNSFLG